MKSKTGGLSYITFLTFLVLKLCGVIDWSWWWITAPLWYQAIIVLLGFVALFVAKKKMQ